MDLGWEWAGLVYTNCWAYMVEDGISLVCIF